MKNKKINLCLFSLIFVASFFLVANVKAETISEKCQLDKESSELDITREYNLAKQKADNYQWIVSTKALAQKNEALKKAKTKKAKTLVISNYNKAITAAKKASKGIVDNASKVVAQKKVKAKKDLDKCLMISPVLGDNEYQYGMKLLLAKNKDYGDQTVRAGEVRTKIASFVFTNHSPEVVKINSVNFSVDYNGLSADKFSDFGLMINGSLFGLRVPNISSNIFGIYYDVPVGESVTIDLTASVDQTVAGAVKAKITAKSTGKMSNLKNDYSLDGQLIGFKEGATNGITISKNDALSDQLVTAGHAKRLVGNYFVTNNSDAPVDISAIWLSSNSANFFSGIYTMWNEGALSERIPVSSDNQRIISAYHLNSRQRVHFSVYADISPNALESNKFSLFVQSPDPSGGNAFIVSNSSLGQTMTIVKND
jgi:hypothetical protein